MVIRGDGPFTSGYTVSSSSVSDADRRAAANTEWETNTANQQWHRRSTADFRFRGQAGDGDHDPSDPFGEKGCAGLPSPNPSASYWLQDSEESKRLEDYRSTKELPRYADTVVVGSGITGAFAAWWLLEGTGGEAVKVGKMKEGV